MQPGMPTLVREWLPSRLALGTIGYSSGMLMGAMFPAVFTIAFILPAVGGSWRLDVVLWAIPALLIAPVFLLVSPKIPEDVDKQAAGGGRWWPDWKNPVVWLLGFTFASNNSPYFVTSAFLGDYLATLGKPELLGAALGWLNGSQLLAMAVLFLTANRPQMRAWPFLVFGPTMLAAFLVMMIFVTSSLAIVAATAVIGIAGAVSMTATRPAAVVKFASGRAAHCSRHVHDQLHLRDHHSDDLRRAVGLDGQTVDRFRTALFVRRCAGRAWHGRDQA